MVIGGVVPLTVTDAEILTAAAELIEKNGWWDGTPLLGKSTAKECVVTAILNVGRELSKYKEAGFAMRRFARFVGTDRLAEWNDAQPNGAAVISALREAAGTVGN